MDSNNNNRNGMPFGNGAMPYENQNSRNYSNPDTMPYDRNMGNGYNGYNGYSYYGGMYYPMNGNEMENQADVRYMKEMYPNLAKRIQVLVDEECDKLEYEGSPMFDEYPDKVLIYQIVQRIVEQLIAENALSMQQRNWDDEEDMEDRRDRRNVSFDDIVQILLLHEMFRRRANRRNRRKRYW